MALNCKGKNKAGGPCGMRPPKGQDWCIRHAGGATETPPAAEQKPPEKKKSGGVAAAEELSAAAAVGIGAGIGLLGLCAWFLFRPAAAGARKLRLVA